MARFLSAQKSDYHQYDAISPGWILPSWLTSVIAHGLLFLICTWSLRSCNNLPPGVADADNRAVGIVLKPADPSVDKVSDQQQQQANQPFPANTQLDSKTTQQKQTTDANPPAQLMLPRQTVPAVLAPGPIQPESTAAGDISDIIPSGVLTSPTELIGNEGGVKLPFSGVVKGTRFVYLIDASGSMTDHNAIAYAKAELKASIASLEKNHQFQVIFYNQYQRMMKLNGAQDKRIYFATAIHKTQAGQFINGIQADLGTDHMPALKKALRLDPEVLFLLTDADEPTLSVGELDAIKRLNNSRTQIHCVEFGQGSNLRKTNFLKQLAQQNGGSYRYVDITRFGK